MGTVENKLAYMRAILTGHYWEYISLYEAYPDWALLRVN